MSVICNESNWCLVHSSAIVSNVVNLLSFYLVYLFRLIHVVYEDNCYSRSFFWVIIILAKIGCMIYYFAVG